MTCYSPLHGFKGALNSNGKRPVVFKAPAGSEKQDVPCGRCVGCRLDYSRGWAVRCMHEAQMYENNCFLTLTFDEAHLPLDGNLDVKVFQDFMKRLRKQYGRGIRYFHAGEYGGVYGRPHYHALVFNHDFSDKRLVSVRNGNRLYESPSLSKLWPFGFHSIGDVTFASAAYVARYCVKKAEGKLEVYRGPDGKRYEVNRESGVDRIAEYTTMSRRPGIGATWFEKFGGDVFPSDEVIVEGMSVRPPRFYDNLLDKKDPDLLESLKFERSKSLGDWNERSDLRLRVKEEVKLAQVKSLKRELEVA